MLSIFGSTRIVCAVAFVLSMRSNLYAQQTTLIARPLTTPGSPFAIAVGSDGALWFTDGTQIGRIAGNADATYYFASGVGLTSPEGLTTGPDGALWFSSGAQSIGRMTTAGAVTYYPLGDDELSNPQGITAGPEGALWFAESPQGTVGRLTTTGAVTLYPGADGPFDITTGPDGALWFTEYSNSIAPYGNSIGRVTTDGVMTYYPVPTAYCGLSGITSGPDGALWFTENYASKIGRITTAGVVSEYPTPTVGSGPQAITAGADGALWFTETQGNNIGRITTDGAITEYAIPTSGGLGAAPQGIAALPDGTIWFTESGSNMIGEVIFITADLFTMPASLSPGSSITLLANGFGAGETVNLYSNSTGTNLLGTAVADGSGAFNAIVTVPELPSGINNIVGVGQTTGKLGVATYYVDLNLAPGQIFADVAPSSYYYAAVNMLQGKGITSGCQSDPALYCPTENVTRAEMAIFIVRAIQGQDNFPYNPTPYFNDVPANAFGFQWIQKLYELGISAGCGNGDFCPNDYVTRDQMAILIIRARYGSTTNFTWNATPYFADVPSTYYAFDWIQRLYEDGVTAGCGAAPLTYCPSNLVNRGDMAIFIVRGCFDQLLPATAAYLTGSSGSIVLPGSPVQLAVYGVNTTFEQGVTQVMLPPGSGITVNSIAVISPNEMQVTVTGAPPAPYAWISIYEQTGAQAAVWPNAFLAAF